MLPGIFCIETSDWWGSYGDTSSVRPVLDLLAGGIDPKPNVVHRSVATREELRHYLGRWRRTRRFPILWLAFHGAPGVVYLDDRGRKSHTLTLDDIATMIGPRLSERLIHLGSCSTLNIDRRRITRFLRRTGMVAATGFRRDLDWLTSSALECVILSTLLRYRLTLDGARRMERALRREATYLRRQLAFRIVLRDP